MRMNVVSGTLTVKDVDDQRKNSLNIVSGAKGTAIRKKKTQDIGKTSNLGRKINHNSIFETINQSKQNK